MLKYFGSRLLTFIPTFLGVTLISFAFIRVLPGDPIIVMAGERGLTATAIVDSIPSVIEAFESLFSETDELPEDDE